jgi:hypothetical protein
MTTRFHAFAFAALALLAPDRRADAHVVLDGEIARPILADIVRDVRDSKEAETEAARLEALFLVGQRTDQLVELMNLDLLAHGRSLLGELLVRRLLAYGIRVDYVERSARYLPDLAPFEEYLRRAPAAPRAADAKLYVIAEMFRRSAGARPEEIADGGVEALRNAVAREEAFLRDHPGHDGAKDVQFFLAMDYYRLFKNSADPAAAKRYERLARESLQRIVQARPGTAEARSAEVALEALAGERSSAGRREP